jgi:hypothetical protein
LVEELPWALVVEEATLATLGEPPPLPQPDASSETTTATPAKPMTARRWYRIVPKQNTPL